jgi:RNA polymerase sigma-70 factor (ECF subfamily)
MNKPASDFAQDVQFVKRVLACERVAEEEFFKRVWVLVNCHAHAWGIRAADAEDLAAEVVVKALGKLNQFGKKRAKLETWIFVLARNHAYDKLRRSRNDPIYQESLELQEWMESRVSDGTVPGVDEQAVVSPPLFDRLDEALAQLAPEERSLLELSITGGDSAEEIGKQLNITANQVRVKKHRLLVRMRTVLSV